jgi:DNA-binding MarR family transcriptional regulator
MNKILVHNDHSSQNGINGGQGIDGVNGHRGSGVDHAQSSEITDQAREMTALVLGVTRQLLAVDDQAAELPLRQLRVCMALHEEPRSMTALGRELGMSLSAMTQIADRLERAGLVKRSLEGTDRRVRCLQLTPRGQKMMKLREQIRIQRVSGVVRTMSQHARNEVLSALQVLLTACTAANA